MTFNENADISGNRAQRRGRGAAIAGGATVGGLGLVVLLLNLLTGGNIGDVLGGLVGDTGSEQQPAVSGESLDHCRTGADANAHAECLLAGTTEPLDLYWADQVEGYRPPTMVVVDGSTPTQCGTASNQTGPFYCPPEETVYMDPTFLATLQQRYGGSAASLAQIYVLAHEYGHHVQNITGEMEAHPPGDSGPDSNGVRIELRADCFAGAFIRNMAGLRDDNGVAYLQEPTDAQLRDALSAAAAVGDDHIQETATGQVNPESWTHGSSEQRERWFLSGYQDGIATCDTFSVSGGDL